MAADLTIKLIEMPDELLRDGWRHIPAQVRGDASPGPTEDGLVRILPQVGGDASANMLPDMALATFQADASGSGQTILNPCQ